MIIWEIELSTKRFSMNSDTDTDIGRTLVSIIVGQKIIKRIGRYITQTGHIESQMEFIIKVMSMHGV